MEAAVASDKSVTVQQNIAEDVTFLRTCHGRKNPETDNVFRALQAGRRQTYKG